MARSKPKKKLDCLIYAYERIRTEYTGPPRNIPSSWDSYDREFGWSREDYNCAAGNTSRNTVTTRIVEVRAYFPRTRKNEFIVKGKGDLYKQLPEEQEFTLNGQEYKIVNEFTKGEIVGERTAIPLVQVIGNILRAKAVSEEFAIKQMKKYRRGR